MTKNYNTITVSEGNAIEVEGTRDVEVRINGTWYRIEFWEESVEDGAEKLPHLVVRRD